MTHPTMNRTMNRSSRQVHPEARTVRGFTLPEVLLAGVLGAMLLTALAYATFEFAAGMKHLEVKAGIADEDDAILRQVTRDIREAWWVELENENHILLADEQGDITEYFLDGTNLMVRRPNGDTGIVYTGAANVIFENSRAPRLRDGAPVQGSGAWYVRSTSAGFSFPFAVEGGGQISLAFTAPALQSDLPGSTGDEHVLSLGADVLSLPMAFADGAAPQSVTVSIFESLGPGSAVPVGDALTQFSLDAATLPPAAWDGDLEEWTLPEAVDVDLGGLSGLVSGRGYTVVLAPSGDSQLIVEALPKFGSWNAAEDMVSYQVAGATEWGESTMIVVPFSLSGPYTLTTTDATSQVNRISVTLYPTERPNQTRSASLLSQALSEDSWLGVVPGQQAP